jgi:hypothetical protein
MDRRIVIRGEPSARSFLNPTIRRVMKIRSAVETGSALSHSKCTQPAPCRRARDADATLSDSVAITDMQGRATQMHRPTRRKGSFTYVAFVTHANVAASVYFTLRKRTASTPSGLPAVVEYFNGERSHYFMTSNPEEMQLLDDGTTKGWTVRASSSARSQTACAP